MHGDDHGPGADLLAAVPDAVCHLDRSWRFSYLNAASERLLGRPAEALLGRECREHLPALAGAPLEQRLGEVLRGGAPSVFEHRLERLDRWYELRAFPSPDGLTVFFRDVDEHRRSDERRRAELAELTAALEALPAATVLVGPDGRIEHVNSMWRSDGALISADGLEPGDVGDDYLSVMSTGLTPGDQAALAPGIRRLLGGAGAGRHDQDYASRIGGQPRW